MLRVFSTKRYKLVPRKRNTSSTAAVGKGKHVSAVIAQRKYCHESVHVTAYTAGSQPSTNVKRTCMVQRTACRAAP
jgi:hypothetical protein